MALTKAGSAAGFPPCEFGAGGAWWVEAKGGVGARGVGRALFEAVVPGFVFAGPGGVVGMRAAWFEMGEL